jgi:hypothetical protein
MTYGATGGTAACGTAPLELHALSGWTSVSRPHSPAFVAATMRRSSRPRRYARAHRMGEEHAGVTSYPSNSSFVQPRSRPLPAGLGEHFQCAFVAGPRRRSSANAPPRAGASHGRRRRARRCEERVSSRCSPANRIERRDPRRVGAGSTDWSRRIRQRFATQRPPRTTRPGARTLVSTPIRLHRRPPCATHRRTRRRRGRRATEGGDERAGVRRALAV